MAATDNIFAQFLYIWNYIPHGANIYVDK